MTTTETPKTTAVAVLTRDGSEHRYSDGRGWHDDDNNILTVYNDDGGIIATYNDGVWAIIRREVAS